MKVGDLVKFWDYEGGHGFVEGLVLGVDDYQYSSKLDPVPSACVLYEGQMQIVPIEGEFWKIEVIKEGR